MRDSAKGFTLIELIMVIVIVGILSTITTDIIRLPINSYIDLARRVTLLDSADMTLKRMQRDIRRALPNSVRITGGTVIEFLHTSDGGRYRAKLASDGSGDFLNFIDTDNSFDVVGSLSAIPSGELVIYNLGSTFADAYAGNNRATIDSSSTVDSVVLASAMLFPFQSPQQRFYVVDTPISYSCDGGELRRYDNAIDSSYVISSTLPSLSDLNYKIQAKVDTITCSFSYSEGTSSRAGLVTLEITLADDKGEVARLIQQVHVDNVP